MQQVYSFEVNKDNCSCFDFLKRGCRVQKDLYNQALYTWHIHREELNEYIHYNDFNKLMKTVENLEGEINYRLGKTQVAQQTLRRLDTSISSFFKAIKKWKENPSKFSGRPNFPKYIRKKGYTQMTFTNQSISIKEREDGTGHILVDKYHTIDIPNYSEYKHLFNNFNQIRFIPSKNCEYIKVEIVYTVDDELYHNTELDYSRFASCDLGLVNLMTVVTDFCEPIIFSGKEVKSYNNFFNKHLAKAKSDVKLINKYNSSNRIRNLYHKRDNYLNDIFQKTTTALVQLLIDNHIGNFTVGYNKEWKQNQKKDKKLKKKTRQQFQHVPYSKLLHMLKYKCERAGIIFKEVNESHTSKCDALAFEEIEHHDNYLGKRVKRGLYKSSTGQVINADVNGALNIMRRSINDSS